MGRPISNLPKKENSSSPKSELSFAGWNRRGWFVAVRMPVAGLMVRGRDDPAKRRYPATSASVIHRAMENPTLPRRNSSARVGLLMPRSTAGATLANRTHDQQLANTGSARMAVFDDEVIQQIGTSMALYDRRANRFVADLRARAELQRSCATLACRYEPATTDSTGCTRNAAAAGYPTFERRDTSSSPAQFSLQRSSRE